MKFEIDIENSSLSEYFTEENDGIVFTDIFKEEVVREFLRKMSWDSEFRTFVRNEIKEGLYPKIREWKQDTAIKLIVEEVIKEELSPLRSGSYFYMKEYEQTVKTATKKVLAGYVSEIKSLIETTIRSEVDKVMESLYQDHKMREFLNMDKLTAYVIKTMREPKESEGEG
jgi:hypothetical protein